MEGRTPLELLFKWHDEISGRVEFIRHDAESMYLHGIVVITVTHDFHVAMFVGERLPIDGIDGNLSKRLQIFREFAAMFMLVFHHLPGEHGNGPQIFDLIMLLDDCKIVPLYGIYEDFIDYNSRVERIKTFGNNIQNNIDKFFDASSKFVKARGLDGKLLLIGQILSAVTDFVFD